MNAGREVQAVGVSRTEVRGARRIGSSAWPARLDLLQSGSGLLLVMFMWTHMVLVSSILISRDAMWTVARFFEGYFIFGRRMPWLVAIIAGTVFVLVIGHAALAMRKFPASYTAHRTFREHMAAMRHADTTYWYWQVVTGFALFFIASLHIGTMLTRPDLIGPFESADRVWSDYMWPIYLVLLFAVEVHAGLGLYRLALKWGWLEGRDAQASRRRLRVAKWGLTLFFILLGLLTLAAYVRIGVSHVDHYGERYNPPWYGAPAP